MLNRKKLTIGFIIAGIVAVLWFVVSLISNDQSWVGDFEDCIKAGNPAMESYPRQCRTNDGRTFVEDIGDIVLE